MSYFACFGEGVHGDIAVFDTEKERDTWVRNSSEYLPIIPLAAEDIKTYFGYPVSVAALRTEFILGESLEGDVTFLSRSGMVYDAYRALLDMGVSGFVTEVISALKARHIRPSYGSVLCTMCYELDVKLYLDFDFDFELRHENCTADTLQKVFEAYGVLLDDVIQNIIDNSPQGGD